MASDLRKIVYGTEEYTIPSGGEGGECHEYSLGWLKDKKSLTLIEDGEATVQTLELEGVSMEEDTGWQSLPIPSGSNGRIVCRRINGVVYLHIAVAAIEITGNSTICTLPEGFRPGYELYAIGGSASYTNLIGVTIRTNGEIAASKGSATSATGVNLVTSFPADA